MIQTPLYTLLSLRSAGFGAYLPGDSDLDDDLALRAAALGERVGFGDAVEWELLSDVGGVGAAATQLRGLGEDGGVVLSIDSPHTERRSVDVVGDSDYPVRATSDRDKISQGAGAGRASSATSTRP